MALYAIADIHLAFGCENKCMSIFKGWGNHEQRLQTNWNRLVGTDDTVVIAGDVSWAKTLAQALPDFEFIANELSGKKIILKGNHDYWWTTLLKMREFLLQNNISNIDFLYNNAYESDGFSICGTRGWINDGEMGGTGEADERILLREAARLETSLESAPPNNETLVFLHYPPLYSYESNEQILEVIKKYAIKQVFSGHIHSSGMNNAFIGEKGGTYFDMITADFLNFTPRKILTSK